GARAEAAGPGAAVAGPELAGLGPGCFGEDPHHFPPLQHLDGGPDRAAVGCAAADGKGVKPGDGPREDGDLEQFRLGHEVHGAGRGKPQERRAQGCGVVGDPQGGAGRGYPLPPLPGSAEPPVKEDSKEDPADQVEHTVPPFRAQRARISSTTWPTERPVVSISTASSALTSGECSRELSTRSRLWIASSTSP